MLTCQQTVFQGPSEITKDGEEVETHHHFFSIQLEGTFPKVCFRSNTHKNLQDFKSILPPTTAFLPMPPSFASSSFTLILHTLYHFGDFLKELEESYEKADVQVILFDFEDDRFAEQDKTLRILIHHLHIPDNYFLIFRAKERQHVPHYPFHGKRVLFCGFSTPLDSICQYLCASEIPTLPLVHLAEGLYLEIEDCPTTPKGLMKTHVEGRFFYPHPITNHTSVTFEWVAQRPTKGSVKLLLKPSTPFLSHIPDLHLSLNDLVALWIEDKGSGDSNVLALTSIMTYLAKVTTPTHPTYKSIHQKIKDDIARHTAFHKALETLSDFVDTSSFSLPSMTSGAITDTLVPHDSSSQLMSILNMCQQLRCHQAVLRERGDRSAQEKLMKGQTIFDAALMIINAFDTPPFPPAPHHVSRQFSFCPSSVSPLFAPPKPPAL